MVSPLTKLLWAKHFVFFVFTLPLEQHLWFEDDQCYLQLIFPLRYCRLFCDDKICLSAGWLGVNLMNKNRFVFHKEELGE